MWTRTAPLRHAMAFAVFLPFYFSKAAKWLTRSSVLYLRMGFTKKSRACWRSGNSVTPAKRQCEKVPAHALGLFHVEASIRRWLIGSGRRRCSGRRDWLQAQPLAAFLQDGHGVGGGHPAHPEVAYGQQRIEIANAARRLDLDVSRRMFAHQFKIGESCPAGRIPGGGLDPIGSNLRADLAQTNPDRVVKIGILKNHFDFCSARMGGRR